ADVVDGHVTVEANVTGLGVDLDDGDVAAGRPGEVRRVVDVGRLEPRLHAVGEVVRGPGREGGLLHVEALVGTALDGEAAGLVLEVVLGHLELVSRDLADLRDDLLARVVERDAADGQAAAAVGVHAGRHDGRVA